MKLSLPHFNAATRLGTLAFLVSAIFAFSSLAYATVMKFADLPTLVDISDVIVQGKVVQQTVLEQNGEMVTRTEIAVSRTFLGEPKATRVFQQWGGVTAEKIARIPGDARFEKGEEVVLFLHTASMEPGLFLSALGQSKYRVVRQDKQVNVWRELDDLSFLVEGTGPTKLQGKPNETVGFESFVAELEALIAAIKGGKQ